MKRSFNYTKRQKILHKDVTFSIETKDGKLTFVAELRLEEYKFHSAAHIWIEAYRKNTWVQWDWGTIAKPLNPQSPSLEEFEVADGVLFRVRVVHPDENERKKLLGEIEGIRPKSPESDERQSLITVYPEALGQLIWKLDMEGDGGRPALQINKDVRPSWKELALSSSFKLLVYPEMFRQILTRILIEDPDDDDTDEEWKNKWKEFAERLPGISEKPKDTDDEQIKEEWIEGAVLAFADKLKVMTSWNNSLEDEQ